MPLNGALRGLSPKSAPGRIPGRSAGHPAVESQGPTCERSFAGRSCKAPTGGTGDAADCTTANRGLRTIKRQQGSRPMLLAGLDLRRLGEAGAGAGRCGGRGGSGRAGFPVRVWVGLAVPRYGNGNMHPQPRSRSPLGWESPTNGLWAESVVDRRPFAAKSWLDRRSGCRQSCGAKPAESSGIFAGLPRFPSVMGW